MHNNYGSGKTNVDAVEKIPNGTAESDSRAERPTGHRYAIRGWTETAEFVRGQGACLAVWATDNLE